MTARLLCGGRETAPGAFDAAARRAAARFEELGVGEGDVVCILLRNGPAYLEAMFGARLLGAYSCPINWHYKADEAGWILRDSGAKVLVTDTPLLRQIESGVPGVAVVTDHGWGKTEWNGAPRPPRTSMPYTSGTTGRAKGVRRIPPGPAEAATMEALNREGIARVHGVDPAMRALLSAPLYHSAPNGYATQVMLNGALLVLEERFDAERTLQLIHELKLTHAYLVPTMYVRLLRLEEKTRKKYDLSSIRCVSSTGSPCAAQVKRAMIEWWGPVFNEAYAASELGYVTLITSQEALRKPGSAGRPLGQAALKILDDAGRELPPGEVGLIYARQPAFPDFVYNNNPAARRAIERDGLWSLGDMGYVDADGYLYVCDRASDMVISGGVNIYPAEIEAALITMPGVRDCAVFGIPDEEFGEALCAAVQLDPGRSVTPEEIDSFLRERLSGYKVPKRVDFHAELPREDSGKIFKRRLRAPYWEKSGRRI